MEGIKQEKLILGPTVFEKSEIEKRMADGGFNSKPKFELFIWDLEMFLQLQKRLGDKIILKGGAATQFYIPVATQRTSIDIDMICLATREEVLDAIAGIEEELQGGEEYCKFRPYKPKHPKLELGELETYFVTVPTICNAADLHGQNGKQEVKIEFLFSAQEYQWQKVKPGGLFALETDKAFNLLTSEMLFADKLTTLGPNTIGVPAEKADEQFKQIYDVITLFSSNMDQIIDNKELVLANYKKAAEFECQIHRISYDPDVLFADMQQLIRQVQNIENDYELLHRANDFQSLYLRNSVRRDKAQWAIAGYHLELLANYIFLDDNKIQRFRKMQNLIDRLNFGAIYGPERGRKIREVREALKRNFARVDRLSTELFNKRNDRILWELFTVVSFEEIADALHELI